MGKRGPKPGTKTGSRPWSRLRGKYKNRSKRDVYVVREIDTGLYLRKAAPKDLGRKVHKWPLCAGYFDVARLFVSESAARAAIKYMPKKPHGKKRFEVIVVQAAVRSDLDGRDKNRKLHVGSWRSA